MILIVGATGRLGGIITQRLLAGGHDVRVLLRPNSAAAQLAQVGRATAPELLLAAGAQAVYGDLKEPSSLQAAVAGVRAVICTANTAARSGPDTLDAVDRQGTRDLIDAAVAAGVGHFIYLSAIPGPYADALPLLAAKLEVEAYLEAGQLDHTILRPGTFMESWIPGVVVEPLASGLPVAIPAPGRRKNPFVCIRDVAAYVTAAIDHPAALDQTITVAGPRSLSYLQVVEIARRVLGREIEVELLSPGQPHPLHGPGYGRLLAAMEAAPETPVDMSQAAAVFGIRPTPFEEVAPVIVSPLLAA